MFAWIVRTFWPKIAVFGAKLGGKGGAMLTPNELVLSFWDCYLAATFGKNSSRNATVRVPADRQTDRHAVTETN